MRSPPRAAHSDEASGRIPSQREIRTVTSSSRMVARTPLRRRLSMEKKICTELPEATSYRLHLEYAFDHEVSSLSYVIWRLFRQHRFGFAASILAWSTWSRRSGLATIGGTVRHSKVQVKALSTYSHSMASVLPSRHSSCAQFSVPSRTECRQVTLCRASSASGTKFGTTSKTFFKLRALSFCFCPKGASGRDSGARLGGIARF